MASAVSYEGFQWTYKLDKAGRKNYYKDGKRIVVRDVPVVVMNKVRSQTVKHVQSNETYLDTLPADLKRSLLLYVRPCILRRLKNSTTFKAICDDETYWYNVILDNFTTNPQVKIKSSNFRKWIEYYISYRTITALKKPIHEIIKNAVHCNLGKVITQYIDKVTDPEFLYYILVNMADYGTENLSLLKYIIEDRKIDWPSMYTHGRQTYANLYQWGSLENKYKVHLGLHANPVSGQSLEVTKYLLKYLPNTHIYYQSIMNNMFSHVLYKGNIEIVQFLIDLYNGFDLNDALVHRALYCQNNIDMAKFLIGKGANPHWNNDMVLFTAAKYGDLPFIKFLESIGFDLRTQNDQALLSAAGNYASRTEIISYLLSKGADINTQNSLALKQALNSFIGFGGSVKIIKFLLEKGAKSNGLSPEQQSALKKISAK